MSEEIKDPEAVLAALERAKEDAKKYRERAAELQAKVDAFKDTEAELQSTKDALKQVHLQVELEKRGLDAKRITKYADLSKVDMNEEGLTGLDEALDTAKQDFPELFDAKRRVGGAVESYANDANVDKSTTELQVDRLLKHNNKIHV